MYTYQLHMLLRIFSLKLGISLYRVLASASKLLSRDLKPYKRRGIRSTRCLAQTSAITMDVCTFSPTLVIRDSSFCSADSGSLPRGPGSLYRPRL